MTKPKKIPEGYMKVSKSQLIHIMNAASIMSACLGGMSEEAEIEWSSTVKGIDRFLDSNGLKREYK